MNQHTLLNGEILDLSGLDQDDRTYLAALRDARDADYFDLLRRVKGPGARALRDGRITPAVSRSTLYRVAEDIATRVGIEQGWVLAPGVDISGLEVGNDLLSMTEAADLLEITRPAVHQALKEGRLRGRRVGNAWVIKKADAEAYLRDRREREARSSGSAPSDPPPRMAALGR